MLEKKNLCCKQGILLLLTVLVLPILTACDDDDDDGITVTVTETATATASATSTTTTDEPTTTAATSTEVTQTTSDEPVKMGIAMALSGPMAMAGALADQVVTMVEKMVEENGGIQVGSVKRPVEFIWYDTKGEISGGQPAWTKLVTQEHISIMAMAGTGGAECENMADLSSTYKVPYIDFSSDPHDLTDYPYTSRAAHKRATAVVPIAKFILDLKPKTVALLGDAEASDHEFFDMLKSMAIDPIEAEVVYEQYVTLGTADYTPYLTRIKGEDPDVIVHYGANFQAFGSVYQNIDGLGGWGDMTYIGASAPANSYQKMPSAVGTYQWMMWAPTMDNPGTTEYLQACERHKVQPNPTNVNFWNALWTAIHAVEQAGSDDPEMINETLRSGEFQWEAPTGLLKMGTDGEPGISGVMVRIGEGGQVTIIE